MNPAPTCILRTCTRPAIQEEKGTSKGEYTVCEWHAAFYRRVMRCPCGTRMIGEAWRYRGGLCSACWTRTREPRAMRWIAEKANRKAS